MDLQPALFPLPDQLRVAPQDRPREVERYEALPQLTWLKERRALARLAFAPPSPAYAELGGGIETAAFEVDQADKYGRFIDNYEPWKTDITTAFEHFNLYGLTRDIVDTMTQEDRTAFAHHFTHFVDAINSKSKVLAVPGVTGGELGSEYGLKDDDAAHKYAVELHALHDLVEESDIFRYLEDISRSQRRTRRQRDAFVRHRKRTRGTPYLILDTKFNKYRLCYQTNTARAA